MIDRKMLMELGWSEELIRTATDVLHAVEVATISVVEIDAPSVPVRTAASERADVSGPPIARTELVIQAK